MDLFLSFKGRINRAKFWLGFLGLMVVYAILGVVAGGAMMASMSGDNPSAGGMGAMGIVVAIVYLASLWPALAIQVKRWHDRNKSGWWVLIAFVPVIGGLWMLIECGFLEGTKGANQFGADPLGG